MISTFVNMKSTTIVVSLWLLSFSAALDLSEVALLISVVSK